MLLRRADVVCQVSVDGDDGLNLNQSEMMMLMVVKVLLDCSKSEDTIHI